MYETLGFTIKRGTLAPGDAGIRQTVEFMRKLAHVGARQLVVREKAIEILRNAGAREHDPMSELTALFRWVRDRVRFTNDIAGVETLQSPRYTLRVMSGDCDDRATLLAALAIAVGIPARFAFRVIGADRSRPGRFSHVYLVARVNGRDVPLDPTYTTNEVGQQFARPSRLASIPI